MTLVIDATSGGASANSYVTLAECATYMAARLNSDLYDAATTDVQNRALVEATREITNLGFVGQRATSTQTLAWPRWSAPDPDSPTGWLYSSTVVPTRVKDATCELAFQFIGAGTTDIAALDANVGVIEKTIDVLTTRWQPWQRPVGIARFPSVLRTLRPLLIAAGNSAPLVRG